MNCYLHIPGGEEAVLVVRWRKGHMLVDVEGVVPQPHTVTARFA